MDILIPSPYIRNHTAGVGLKGAEAIAMAHKAVMRGKFTLGLMLSFLSGDKCIM